MDGMMRSETNRRWLVLLVVVAAQFMFVVDAFIANVALPALRRDLRTSAGMATAVIAVYQLAYAALVVTGGRLGDLFGRRRIFLLGVLAFTASSAWCGLARTGAELVAARVAQGGAAALMVPQVLATIHLLFPGPERTRAFACFGAALGLGGAVGFALGGWLVALDLGGLGWRCVFLVNLPVGAAIALAGWRLMPRLRPAAARRLDLGGAALLFAGLVLLVGPVLAGPELGWPAWLAADAALGAGLLGLFLARQRRRTDPLVDLALLADPAYRRGLAAVTGFQLGNVSFYLLMTLHLQTRLGLPPERAGLAMLPLAVAFSLAAQLSGRWIARHGRVVLVAGCALQLAALALLADAAGGAGLAGALLVFGFGQGLVMAPLSGLVLASVAPGHAGLASGLLNTVQQAAGAIGVALVAAAFQQSGLHAGLAVVGTALAATCGLLARLQPPKPVAP